MKNRGCSRAGLATTVCFQRALSKVAGSLSLKVYLNTILGFGRTSKDGNENLTGRASSNTRLAHTRLNRPPEDRVKADLYRANCKWVLQVVVY